MYTCIVNWFCVNLYSELVLCKLVQYIGFVYTCTVSWLCIHYVWFCAQLYRNWFCDFVGTHFAQSWHSDWTKFACLLHKVCTNFAIHQQLVSIKIKFKLSSSQESSQCLLIFQSYLDKGFCIIYFVKPKKQWSIILLWSQLSDCDSL